MNSIPSSRRRTIRSWSIGPGEAELVPIGEGVQKPLVDLASNDYLGLSRHPEIIKAAQAVLTTDGVGAGGSRFITGSRSIHYSLEERLANWLGREKVFLFPSGFQANLAAVMALADRYTPVLADRLCHHSLLIGTKASGAKLLRFKHNDLEDMEKCLRRCVNNKPKHQPLVLTESLFSMEGTSPDLAKMASICDKYGANLLVDEAHAIGILGPDGKGLSHGILGPLRMISGTFGKAFGGGGAFLATNKLIGERLLQLSGAFRYTTALAPPLAAAALASLELIIVNPDWGLELQKDANNWLTKLQHDGWKLPNVNSHILPIILGTDEEALYRQNQLEKEGYLSVAIRPPTVPEGKSRLRLAIRKNLPKKSLENVLEVLRKG